MARIYHNEDENRNGDFIFEKRSSGNIIDVFYIPSLEKTECRSYGDFDRTTSLYTEATGILPMNGYDFPLDITLYWGAITQWPLVPTNFGSGCEAGKGIIRSLRRLSCGICRGSGP